MKRKIVIYCFLIALLAMTILFGSALAVTFILTEADVKDGLTTQTAIYAKIVDEGGVSALEGVGVETFGSTRLTLIAEDGSIIMDTAGVTEPHDDREEIVSALAGEPKIVKRFSASLNKSMYYYALKSESGIVVRVAVDTSNVGGYVRGAIPVFILALVIATGVSLLFAERLSFAVTGKIQDVRKSLASLNRGEYEPIETSSKDPEFYAMLAEINALSASIGRHIVSEREERAKLDCILDNVSQGVISLGEGGKILQINKSAKQLFGGSDKPTKELLEDLKSSVNSDERTRGFGSEYNGRFLIVNSVCPDNAGDIKEIFIITDVTDQNSMMKQKSDFFANASHELKTPLTSMQGMAELLMVKENGENKFAERIYTEATRMNSLIMDMLKLSKIEGHMAEKGELTEVNLRELSEEVILEYSAKAVQKRLKTHVIGDGVVVADEKKIYELIVNLYTNAVNYNRDDGEVKIEIINQDKSVKISVSDTGIGIEKEHIPRLCERFYRVDKSRSKKTGGTGLGLAIVKHVCALYGADMTIESEINVGTTVTIVFPK